MDALERALRQILDPRHVLSAPDRKAPYERDYTDRYRGQARLVVRPADTDEVAAVMRTCAEHRVAVVPQGGNTGLVGGGVPRADEVLISLARLTQIGEVDTAL